MYRVTLWLSCHRGSASGLAGQLGGLLGLLSSGLASHYLVLACDQPLLNASLLSALTNDLDDRPTVFAGESHIYPLPGLYPASLLPFVEKQLSHGRASLKFLLQTANARLLPLPENVQTNLRGANTPQEFAELSAEFMNRLTDFKKVQ
jgi:molybdopterin-guanine dinucleotide biosynthesis protein A